METAVDAERRPRRRLRWLALLVLVVAVAAVVLLRGFGTASTPSLPEALADRVVQALEQATPSDHAHHGHYFDDATTGIVCEAETFGFEPAAATTVDEVRVVYVHHMCAEVGTGYPWPHAVRTSGPIAVELTDPVIVHAPEQALVDQPDVLYADRIRAVIPEEYHAAALGFDSFTSPEVAEALRKKFEKASG